MVTEKPIVRFYTGAIDFWEAAQKLEDGLPRVALALHAAELALKSFLLSTGMTLPEVTKIGHDLERLLELSEKRGIGQLIELEPIQRDHLSTVSSAHKKRLLLYEATGHISGFLNCADSLARTLCVKPIRWTWERE